MIERHKYLIAANDDTVIWHYMTIPNFIYLLNQRLLYFSRVDHLEDKAEVLVSDIEKQYWKTLFRIDLDPWIESERKKVFINCWIKSSIELSTMWSAYATHGEGVAIKTTVDRLIRSYTGEALVTILDVNYIDYKNETVQPQGDRINVLRFFSAKRIFYKPEQELRLIYESSKADEFSSFQIPIDIDTLVEELRVGPNANSDILSAIRTLVSAAGCHFPVLNSELLYP